MKLEAARVGKCLAAIEGRLSTPVENRDHLLTSGFSAADVAVGQAVYMAKHFTRLGPYPSLHAWFDRITARPAFVASLPKEGQAVYMARHFHRLDAFPETAAWYERITSRPGFEAALPPEGAERLYERDFYEAWDEPRG